MLDIAKLSNEITQKGLTVNMLADSIGVNKSTLYRKLNKGGDKFLLWEIESIIKILGLSKEKAVEIFLT